MVKLSTDELETIKSMTDKTERIAIELGAIKMQSRTLKARKILVLNDADNLNKSRTQFFSDLQVKYGQGNLNMQTGEFELYNNANDTPNADDK